MNKLWYIAGFIVLLYFLKVPSVVKFSDGITSYLAYNWNFILDVGMNVKDRHPWVWISLPFILLLLWPKGDHA